ncbi:MAG: hypothetical protein HOJ99_04610 [Porticoccaceae bacterium]|nr:hypothetical protein [Porticoccaceae bacterium]
MGTLTKSGWWRVLLVAAVIASVLAASYDPNPLPDFAKYQDVRQKKTAFFDYMLPLVKQANEQLLADRSELEQLASNGTEPFSASQLKTLKRFAKSYGFDTSANSDKLLKQLLLRVDQIPPSLALAQAAIESAWGTSRFATEGNNLFGQWCYKKGCGIVPLRRNSGTNHEVAKYSTVAAAVGSYMKNINSHRAYSGLRKNRDKLRRAGKRVTGHKLAENLLHYSELREVYVREVQAVIRINQLAEFD